MTYTGIPFMDEVVIIKNILEVNECYGVPMGLASAAGAGTSTLMVVGGSCDGADMLRMAGKP